MSHYTHYPLHNRDISQVGGSFTLDQLITINKRIPGVSFTPAYSYHAFNIHYYKKPSNFGQIFEQLNVQELPYFIVYPLEHHEAMMTVLSLWLSIPTRVSFKSPSVELI